MIAPSPDDSVRSAPQDVQRPRSARDLPAIALLLVIAVVPWLIAGVEAFVQTCLLAAIGVILLVTVLLSRSGRDRIAGAVSPTLLLLLCAMAIGAIQLIPLPASVRKVLSPGGEKFRAELLPHGNDPDLLNLKTGIAPPGDWLPLTMSTAATRRDLAVMILGVSVFFLGSTLFVDARRQRWLMLATAINGAALVFFALAQKVSWSGLLYWCVDVGDYPFGPFINENNAGGYFNLCLAGVVGVWMLLLGSGRPAPGISSDLERPRRERTLTGGFWSGLLEGIGGLNGWVLSAFGLTSLLVAGVVCSLSRGAWIAMVAAAIGTVVLVAWARPHGLRLWLMTVIAASGLGLVAWAGLQEIVSNRFDTLLTQETYKEHQLPSLWRDSLAAVPQFWPIGSGLGTYRYVYRPFEFHAADSGWSPHAENHYVESLLDAGIPGLLLLLGVIALVARSCWQVLHAKDGERRRDKSLYAFGVAATFALITQVIQGVVDFAMYIPANLMLFALICGAVTASASQCGIRNYASPVRRFLRSGPVSAAMAAMILLGCLWGFLEMRRCADVEIAWSRACTPMDPLETRPEHLELLIAGMQPAVLNRPDDPEAQYHLAQLRVSLYRLRALEQLRKEVPDAEQALRLWEATSSEKLHGRIHELNREGKATELKELRSAGVVSEHLVPALQHLVQSRDACPLLWEVHLMLAQLCGVVQAPQTDVFHIAHAGRCSPAMPDVRFQCGRLYYQGGQKRLAYDEWRRTIALTASRTDMILDIVAQDVRDPKVLERLVPDDPELMVRLAQQRFAGDEYAGVRDALLSRAERLAQQPTLPQELSYYLNGAISAARGHDTAAVEQYRQATRLDPSQITWRYEFAVLLQRTGDLDGAIEQAKACARSAPNDARYRDLLSKLYEQKLRN